MSLRLLFPADEKTNLNSNFMRRKDNMTVSPVDVAHSQFIKTESTLAALAIDANEATTRLHTIDTPS